MITSHIASHVPAHSQRQHQSEIPLIDDPLERAMQELVRAGIGFEIVCDDGDWERAA